MWQSDSPLYETRAKILGLAPVVSSDAAKKALSEDAQERYFPLRVLFDVLNRGTAPAPDYVAELIEDALTQITSAKKDDQGPDHEAIVKELTDAHKVFKEHSVLDDDEPAEEETGADPKEEDSEEDKD